ncbi:MAG: Abi family protein [Alphaproteobacteria bacterium]|nr:Abi family protein [Alphaproteobacteria bacterium]
MEIEEFRKLLSKKRMGSFEEKYDDPVKYYLQNISISQLYYEYLHFFEITLRNKVANHLKKTWPDWIDPNSDFIQNILKKEQTDQFLSCLKRLKTPKNKEDEDRVISELGLGFWTSLFNKAYDQTIWKQKEFKNIFPNFSKSLGTISKELDEIRRIRNRVFHYEQILTYNPDKNYELIYSYLCNMIPKHHELREKLKELNKLNEIKRIMTE